MLGVFLSLYSNIKNVFWANLSRLKPRLFFRTNLNICLFNFIQNYPEPYFARMTDKANCFYSSCKFYKCPFFITGITKHLVQSFSNCFAFYIL